MTVAAPLELAPPSLDFRVEDVGALEHAVVPTLVFRVVIDAGESEVRSLGLNVQVRIDARGRGYGEEERTRLAELFGPPEAWSRTVHSLLWTHAATTVPPFAGTTEVELQIPCTYDFDVVAAKYLHALRGGTVPVELLFSGTLFFAAPDGRLQVAHLPWDREARCRLPVRVWREAVDAAFPNAAWLRVGRDVFDRLSAYRAANALPGWDATLEELLDGRG